MLNPFLLMAVFYLIVAIVAAVDAALTSFTLLPWFVGLPWLRVHFITLGVFTEAAFGVLPAFVAVVEEKKIRRLGLLERQADKLSS